MNKKLLFFDIDGTLILHGTIIPESTKEALRKLKEQGHLIFLATGRSKSELPESILEQGFDGYVLGAGAYAELRGEVLFHEVLDIAMVKQIAEYIEKQDGYIIYESNETMYASLRAIDMFGDKLEEYASWEPGEWDQFKEDLEEEDNLDNMHDLNKLVYFDARCSIEELMAEFSHYFSVLPNSLLMDDTLNSGEVSKAGITKATGIDYILKHLDMDAKDVIAFGDGMNDLEMIQFVGTGVAMGNAVPALKEAADIIAPDAGQDGIPFVLRQLGLI